MTAYEAFYNPYKRSLPEKVTTEQFLKKGGWFTYTYKPGLVVIEAVANFKDLKYNNLFKGYAWVNQTPIKDSEGKIIDFEIKISDFEKHVQDSVNDYYVRKLTWLSMRRLLNFPGDETWFDV